MPACLRRFLLASTLVLAAVPAAADNDLAEFAAAVERAAAQYHFALRTLETSGREATAAEVRLLRRDWQALIDRLEHRRPAEFADDDFYAVSMTQVDARLVAALIVIDIGSREPAREALSPIGETLARLRERAAPR
jgi:hypothetical protein